MRIDVVPALTEQQTEAVFGLLWDVTDVDGTSPLSEHVILHLRHGDDPCSRHILIHSEDATGADLIAYGHLAFEDPLVGATAELMVSHRTRGQGIGSRLLDALVVTAPNGRLQLWAHGLQAPAGKLAISRGFDRARVLKQMRRSLLAPMPRAPLPDGFTIRTFQPGQDELAWLALNSAAFQALPDQGNLTHADLLARMAEPWFDPAGFFLAEDSAGRLAGFHWTKIHGTDGHEHEPIGEVYVLGVDPQVNSRGLGKALTLVGLKYLRAKGISSAMLYVDEANSAALRLYEGLGFAHWDTDVLYRRSGA